LGSEVGRKKEEGMGVGKGGGEEVCKEWKERKYDKVRV
jgi:hypothetical protein